MKFIPPSLAALLLCLTVAGCGRSGLSPRDIRPLSPMEATRIDGLDSALARSPDRPVRVLLVHGMRMHEAEYSLAWQRRLGEALGMVPSATSKAEAFVERGYDFAVRSGGYELGPDLLLPRSELRRWSWSDPRQPEVERLVFYELLWAPLRDRLKSHLIACFETGKPSPGVESCPDYGASRNADRQATVNRLLKQEVMVGGFADATLALGDVADVLRDDVTLAACIVAAEALGRPTAFSRPPDDRRCALVDAPGRVLEAGERAALGDIPFFTITHSLGGFLVMDAQRRFAEAKVDEAKASLLTSASPALQLFDSATVFMMANQVSLLHLGRVTAVCRPRNGSERCPNPALPTVGAREAEFRPVPPTETRYVAFNDVDDLLGFELPWYLSREGLFAELVNVSVRNPGPRFFGLVKPPLGTHTRYHENPAVIRAIAHGFDLPSPPSDPR